MKPIADIIAAALDLSHDVKDVKVEGSLVVAEVFTDRTETRRVVLQVVPE